MRKIIETTSRFSKLKFNLYDETTDPMEHLTLYQHVMCPINLPHEKREAIMCKIFSMSLKGVALNWSNSLEA